MHGAYLWIRNAAPFTSPLLRDMSLTVLRPTFRNLAANSATA